MILVDRVKTRWVGSKNSENIFWAMKYLFFPFMWKREKYLKILVGSRDSLNFKHFDFQTSI